MRWLDGITSSKDMRLSKLQELVEGQGNLACCSPWGHKESDMTEQLTNNNKCSSGANKWFGWALCMPSMPYRCMTYVGKEKKKTTNVFATQSTSFLVPSLPAAPIKKQPHSLPYAEILKLLLILRLCILQLSSHKPDPFPEVVV